MSSVDKQPWREHFKSWRRALSPEKQREAASALVSAFWQQCEQTGITTPSQLLLGIYHPIAGEVPTDLLLHDCLQRGIRCFLPVMSDDVRDKVLTYREMTQESEFELGALGVSMPKTGHTMSASMLTHLLIPALAVTEQGARIGFGAGYFDATIHDAIKDNPKPPLCWGIVYAEQCVPELPQAPWDERLDAVICVGI